MARYDVYEYIFFFKQKTAYEMLISDWSSDVCSSDLHHAGLDDIKNRSLEFLAVGAFKGEIAGSIVLLVGPPGVGKTSIGKSIAESLGRPFYRLDRKSVV